MRNVPFSSSGNDGNAKAKKKIKLQSKKTTSEVNMACQPIIVCSEQEGAAQKADLPFQRPIDGPASSLIDVKRIKVEKLIFSCATLARNFKILKFSTN